MDCAQFEAMVHDFDRPGTEGFAVREKALAHAEDCSGCAELLTRVESLELDLRSLGTHDAGREAPLRLETTLREAFRRQEKESSRRRMKWQIAALGVAAAAFLALGLSLRYLADRSAPPQASHPTPQLAPAQHAVLGQGEDLQAFVPLPYADDPDGTDGGAVVRVVLSQSALASLGLSVANLDDASDVSADLVVSEDGTPQAIRFLSQSDAN